MNPDGRGHRFPWMPIAVFLAVAAAIAAGGRFLYLQEVAQYKKQKGDELAAIAKLKVGQIAAWREERIADGLRLTKDPFFARAAADYAADAPGQEERRRLLLSCLNTFPEAYDYLSAQLLTADGKVLAGAGESADNIGEHAHKLIHKAIAQGRPEFSDLHEAAAVQRIHMDVLIPILNGDGKEAKSAALVLLLRLNPVPYLYPLIQSWPTPSATAETVLVRRDGDSVLFLNELRHRKHTAMRLRTPLLDQYPGSRAVAGERGVFEGVDYRGEPVLAAVTQVPESTWGLVAKVDQSEIYAPLRKEARRASFSAAALILAAGLLMVYLWKRRDTALYRERHRMEMERDALVQHFDLVMRNGNDIILLADDNCRIREANDRAIAAYGYPWEELRELRLDDLRAEGAKASLPRHLERAEKEGGIVYETEQRRRNGASFPAEVSLRCIESGGAKFYQAIIRDISERKRAEKDLLCERDQAQTYLDVAGVAIIALDREGRITLINRAGWSGLGYQNACELAGKNWFDVCRMEAERPKARALFAQLMSGEGGAELLAPHENPVLTRSGGQLIFSFHSALLRDAAGRPSGVLFSGADVTARHKAEERLTRINRLYAVMIHINQAVVRVQDRETLFRSACGAFVEFGHFRLAWIGLADEPDGQIITAAHAGVWEAPSKPTAISLRPEDSGGRGPATRAILENRCVVLNDALADPGLAPWREDLRKRGHRSLAAVPLRVGKAPVGVLCLHALEPNFFGEEECRLMEEAGSDISFALEMLAMTERRQQAESERMRLAQVVEQTAEAVVITNTDGAIVYVNPAFETMTGYSRAEAAGQNLRLLNSGKQSPEFYREMWDTLQRGEPWSGAMINRRKDGALFEVEAIIAPIRAADGRIVNYVADIRDTSREKQLERQFYQSQKMEAVGKLAGGVAHDFNNQLHAILGFCHILLDGLPSDDPHRPDIQEIQAASERAAELTRQLLAYSHPQPSEIKTTAVNDLIQNLNRMLDRLIGKNVRMVETLDTGLLPVKADAGQIEQVLINLVVNARDAMPGGGTLTITTSNVDIRPGDELLLQPEARAGRFIRIAVSDTGTGMTEEVRSRIFDPFFTTKPVGKGTGMGLAMVYGILRQHGGWVGVASEPGRGSTFGVHLPACAPDPAPESSAPESAEAPPPGNGERILLVEDEDVLRDMTRRILTNAGYEAFAASGAEEAFEIFERENGRVDLIFSDIVLVGMNGINLAENLLKKHPGIPVLLCSGYMDGDALCALQQRPHFRFLQKPCRRSDLLRALHEALHGVQAKPEIRPEADLAH